MNFPAFSLAFFGRKAPFTAATLLATASLLLPAGCSTNADLDLPELQFLRVSPAPRPDTICGQVEQTVYHLTGGDTLELDLLLTDNEALSQLKVDIHANFDCHGHARLAGSAETTENTQDWSVLSLENLSGTALEHSVRLAAPTNPTSGTYHFQLQVVDKAGNSDPTAYVYSIILHHAEDSIAPELELNSPSPGSNLTLARGSQVSVSGTVSDNRALGDGGNGAVKLTYIREANGNQYTATETTIPAATGSAFAYDMNYTIPTTLIPGVYLFQVQAWDGVNNASQRLAFRVDVTN
ncbi:MAG: DUF4625 domain-containing protein [Bacteroidetes bacterium]|nr:DUF4625 domain-containing protein [Bacteroidota bacterium]